MPRRSTKTPIRFEAFMGGTWQAFGGDNAELVIADDKVTVIREVTPEGQKAFKLTTVFNLSQLPAYSFG